MAQPYQSGDRIRHQGNWPPMLAKPLTLGRYVTVYKPTGATNSYDWTLPCRYGWTNICRDAVHPEFLNFRKGRKGKRRDNRKRYRVNDIHTLNGDFGGDFSKLAVLDESVLREIGSYHYEDALVREDYYGGFRADGWPTSGTYADPFNPSSLAAAWTDGTSYSWCLGSYDAARTQGPKAWNKFKPKLSSADLGVFLGEIREVLPMMKTTAKIFADLVKTQLLTKFHRGETMPRWFANHWLNTQFGWKPFIGDLVKFFQTFTKLDACLLRAIKYNGVWHKRGGILSSTQTVVEDMFPSARSYRFAPFETPGNRCIKGGTSRISSEILDEIWFEGAFKYWVPEFESPSGLCNSMAILLRQYGLTINPLLVWNLTPWSWLADWVGNVGDNIANYSTASDTNLAAQYAYIMRKRSLVLTNTSTINVSTQNGTLGSLQCEWKRWYIAKTRRHASPFGFSIDWDGFTSRQWSILGALGIMRVPH